MAEITDLSNTDINKISIDDLESTSIEQFEIDKLINIPLIKGLSAYQIAILNGFVGTEQQWLDSLKVEFQASANAFLEEAKVNEEERISKEVHRQEKETIRIANEDLRNEHESQRTQNETERISNEDTRIKNEELRQIAYENIKNGLVNYYTKSETYSQEEINQMVSAIPKFAIEVVDVLPTESISTTTIYLLITGEESQNLYTEYIYVNNIWEKLGTQELDLTDYYNKTEVDSLLNQKANQTDLDITNTNVSSNTEKINELDNKKLTFTLSEEWE